MKKFKMITVLILILVLFTSCSSDETETCNCIITGTKEISFDYGENWEFNGFEKRSGMELPCYYDKQYTNQESNENGTFKRIFWNCNN